MNLRTKSTATIAVALLLAPCLSAVAFPIGKKKNVDAPEARKLTPAQNALVDKAITRQGLVIKTLRDRPPIVETYIQNMRPDPVMVQSPDADLHFLGRVDFGRVINDTAYERGDRAENKHGFFKHSLRYLTGLSQALPLTYHESGFVQMLLVDSKDFNRSNYTFSYL